MKFQSFKYSFSNFYSKSMIIAAALSSVFLLACTDRVSVKNVQAEEMKQGAEAIEEKLAETKVKSAEEWFRLGVSNTETGNFKEAKKAFKEAIKINPNLICWKWQ